MTQAQLKALALLTFMVRTGTIAGGKEAGLPVSEYLAAHKGWFDPGRAIKVVNKAGETKAVSLQTLFSHIAKQAGWQADDQDIVKVLTTDVVAKNGNHYRRGIRFQTDLGPVFLNISKFGPSIGINLPEKAASSTQSAGYGEF